jgi:hypothetical protein
MNADSITVTAEPPLEVGQDLGQGVGSVLDHPQAFREMSASAVAVKDRCRTG